MEKNESTITKKGDWYWLTLGSQLKRDLKKYCNYACFKFRSESKLGAEKDFNACIHDLWLKEINAPMQQPLKTNRLSQKLVDLTQE